MVARLTSIEFLTDLDDETLWGKDTESSSNKKDNRKWFVEFLLTFPKLVEALTLNTIETFIISYKLRAKKKILEALASQKKLQVTTFCSFITNNLPVIFRNKPWIFTYAFQLANQPDVIQNLVAHIDTDTTMPYHLLQFALWDPSAQNNACLLLHHPEVIAKLTYQQLQNLRTSLYESFREHLNKNKTDHLSVQENDALSSDPNYQVIQNQLTYRIYHKPYQDLHGKSFPFSGSTSKELQLKAAMAVGAPLSVGEPQHRQAPPPKVLNPPATNLFVWHPPFPTWSIATMMYGSMVALGLIIFASLALGDIGGTTHAIQVLHDALHIPGELLYTKIALLTLGLVIDVGIFIGVAIHKHSMQQFKLSAYQASHQASSSLLSESFSEAEDSDIVGDYPSTPTKTQGSILPQNSELMTHAKELEHNSAYPKVLEP